MSEFKKILGIEYFVGSLDSLIVKSREGGLIVVPAAPALAELGRDPDYRRALEGATFAITDSSFLVLLWFLRKGERLERISGLQFLRRLLTDTAFRDKDATFWIMPSTEDQSTNIKWLASQGFKLREEQCYIAPHYARGKIADDALLGIIEKQRPPYIIINIGGGTQEILGSFLHARLSYRPTIICTGAAIAFLSGRQVNIPPWTDKMMLGWLARCISEPRKFIPRYFRAFGLVAVLFRYGDRSVSVAIGEV
jgi:N-acetylglucosaminyldiphosphoundecaprenol N-acetyl-beta-D-mannosaminyltransferase